MSSFDKKEYNRNWSHQHRLQISWTRELSQGHCPICSMLLVSELHIRCIFLEKEDKEHPF
jgi:hypothetical protein